MRVGQSKVGGRARMYINCNNMRWSVVLCRKSMASVLVSWLDMNKLLRSKKLTVFYVSGMGRAECSDET